MQMNLFSLLQSKKVSFKPVLFLFASSFLVSEVHSCGFPHAIRHLMPTRAPGVWRERREDQEVTLTDTRSSHSSACVRAVGMERGVGGNCIRMHVCMYVCMHACMYVCMYV